MTKSYDQKELFTLNMFQKNKQNKLRQTKKNKINEKSYLNYTTIMKYAFCFLNFFIFHQINFLNIHKNTVFFSNFLLVCLLQS